MQRNKHNVLTQKDSVEVQVQSSDVNSNGETQMKHKCKA